ncbi:PREDICTED: myosin-9-like [Lupinus angustifolius]|uniref:myosin-9-like n=1 Tax=Lupinus angustifolius TaxID=3871 RepID=UPI00092E3E62|nr:PREDICTED: myosin-9-like [Lupinus angustifolius]
MEEKTKVATEVLPTKVVEEKNKKDGSTKKTNEDLPQVKKEEDNGLNGEFVKVEKEENALVGKSNITERSSDPRSREFAEAQEKIHELEVELQRLTQSLKTSEHENAQLKGEISATKEKVEGSGKKYEELELSHKKLQEQIIEAENKYNLQLSTLKEALQVHEVKQKELVHVKEALDGVSHELESSRKKTEELQQELQFSVAEARKYEELHKQSGSHAESEGKKTLEYGRILEEFKLSAKGMEDEVASLKEELKGAYVKIAETEKVGEALKKTATELSTIQKELSLSKSHILETERKLSSKDCLADELTQELNQRKTSETQLKEDLSALQNLFVSTKEQLQEKISELESSKLKLQEEGKLRESVEATFKTQEAQEAHVLAVQEELTQLKAENKGLEATVEDLTRNVKQFKEVSADLEEKLKLSDKIFQNTDSLLSQALSNSAELEQKVKSLEVLNNKFGAEVDTASRRNLELEEHIQASNAVAEKAKSQLMEVEKRFIEAEQKNVELEQQLNAVQLKTSVAEREVTEFSEKISHLNTKLTEAEEAKKLLQSQLQEYTEKVTRLESGLNQSSLRSSQLEGELKILNDKCAENGDRASMHHQRSLELEGLFQSSQSKLEDANKKASELGLLLETEKSRIHELEKQIRTLEKRCTDSEANANKNLDKVSDLTSKLEAFQALASSLEISLQEANVREKKLEDSLNAVTDDKKRLEDSSNSLSKKLAEAENLFETVRDELNLTQDKLQSTENDLKASQLRESETIEKLKVSEQNIKIRGRDMDETSARNRELQLLHESLSRDSEQKLQQAIEKFNNKESEVQSLLEKIKILEEQVVEAAKQSKSLKNDFEESTSKLASLESNKEDLRRQIIEAENKSSQYLSENELLIGTNSQLKTKIDELQKLLNSALSEKESTLQQLVYHKNTLVELNDLQSKSAETHAANEAHLVEVESQLHKALQRHAEKESETKELNEKLNALEGKIKHSEKQAQEAVAISETLKAGLSESLLKLKHLETVADDNSKLNHEIAAYESKLSDLQSKLSVALVEKDGIAREILTSKNAIEELVTKHNALVQTLKSEISTVLNEKNFLNETNHNLKKELQSVIFDLEERLKEKQRDEDSLRSEVEKLKIEISEKSKLQSRVIEIEEQLIKSESRLNEEVGRLQAVVSQREVELRSKSEDFAAKVHDRNVLNEKVAELEKELQLARATIANQVGTESQKLELEATLKNSVAELETKNKEVSLLQKQVVDLEQKLQQVGDEISSVQVDDGVDQKDDLEVKSRDIGSIISTPSIRSSKKNSEATTTETTTTETTTTEATSHVSPAINFKSFLGVALVSIIVGVILGKSY